MSRNYTALPLLALLTACGGGGSGPQTISGLPQNSSLVSPTTVQTFAASAATQLLRVTADSENGVSSLYDAKQAPASERTAEVTYDPRDATFNIKVAAAGVDQAIRFQDPGHRTNFPTSVVPALPNQRFYDTGVIRSGTDSNYVEESKLFFYERPGATTQYVTWAGFVRKRTAHSEQENSENAGPPIITEELLVERSAMVFGHATPKAALPKTGSASYRGGMFAFFADDRYDGGAGQLGTISGTANLSVDFQTGQISTALAGMSDRGLAFSASGTAQIESLKQGFSGTFNNVTLGNYAVPIANGTAATINGDFYGPKAEEVGASFRIIGGEPDTRVDFLGAFTGAKTGN